HVRMDGTHTRKLSAESVRAALRRVRGSVLNFVPRGIPGGRNFCPAQQAEMGSPWSVALLRHAKIPSGRQPGGRDRCARPDRRLSVEQAVVDGADGAVGLLAVDDAGDLDLAGGDHMDVDVAV